MQDKKYLSAAEPVLLLLSWLQDLERTQQTLVNTHHCTSIVELSTVVWRREQRNQLSFGEELVSVLNNLVSAAYQVHVVLLKESGDDIWTKSEGDTTVVLGPSGNVLVWVGPEQVAKETAVWDVSWAHNPADLLHGVEIWRETTVHGENLLVNDGSNWQAVEAVGEGLPQLDVVATLALIVETVDTVDGRTLVVTAEDEEVLWVLDLVGEEKADGLKRLLSSVDVVTEEEVVGFRWESSVLKESKEIVVLSVDITANLNWCLELKEDWLGDEDLARLGAKVTDLSLQQLDLLSWSRASHFQQAIDNGIEVHIVLVRHCISVLS